MGEIWKFIIFAANLKLSIFYRENVKFKIIIVYLKFKIPHFGAKLKFKIEKLTWN